MRTYSLKLCPLTLLTLIPFLLAAAPAAPKGLLIFAQVPPILRNDFTTNQNPAARAIVTNAANNIVASSNALKIDVKNGIFTNLSGNSFTAGGSSAFGTNITRSNEFTVFLPPLAMSESDPSMGRVFIQSSPGYNDATTPNGAAGNGAPLSMTAGSGGRSPNATVDAVSGQGGAFTITAGAGGGSGASAATNSYVGGNGGNFSVNGGAGGIPNSTAATNTVGGNAGSFAFTGGLGGTPTAGWSRKGGNSGQMTFSTRNGANGTRTNAGNGGAISFTSGNGGTTASGGLPGVAGAITFTAGNGGTGDTNANGASIYILPGSGAASGNVVLGGNSSGTYRGNVGIGTNAPAKALDVIGNVQFHGSAVDGNGNQYLTNLAPAYASMAMGTGTVVSAASIGPNKFTNFDYTFSSGSIACISNTWIVVTNAGNYHVAWGSGINGQNNSHISFQLWTNGPGVTPAQFSPVELTIIVNNVGDWDTGYKGTIMSLPSNCHLFLQNTNSLSSSISNRNVVFNVFKL